MGTTPKGIPFPNDTDYVRNGAKAMKDLALFVDGLFDSSTVPEHTHSGYASSTHGHTDYASSSHTHPEYALADGSTGGSGGGTGGTTTGAGGDLYHSTTTGFVTDQNIAAGGSAAFVTTGRAATLGTYPTVKLSVSWAGFVAAAATQVQVSVYSTNYASETYVIARRWIDVPARGSNPVGGGVLQILRPTGLDDCRVEFKDLGGGCTLKAHNKWPVQAQLEYGKTATL